MIDIPMKSVDPLNKSTLGKDGQMRIRGACSQASISSLNTGVFPVLSQSIAAPVHESAASVHSPVSHPMPQLLHPVQKGQKVPLCPSGQIAKITACLGWTASNSDCDVDVSAFMLDSDGKVIGDTWFVFYGQTTSPDGSTVFSMASEEDIENISIDFLRLNPSVCKIVFVLTINEAFERKLNFSMLSDAYIRIFDDSSSSQLVSFRMDEYYTNVTSMMIGEIYLHNGVWKFHAIGNGVARDLAGLCALYGVQVE